MEEHRTLACWRISAGKTPHATSVRRLCAECREPLWVMAKNLVHGLRLLCMECAQAEAAEFHAAGDQVFVLPVNLLDKKPGNN